MGSGVEGQAGARQAHSDALPTLVGRRVRLVDATSDVVVRVGFGETFGLPEHAVTALHRRVQLAVRIFQSGVVWDLSTRAALKTKNFITYIECSVL